VSATVAPLVGGSAGNGRAPLAARPAARVAAAGGPALPLPFARGLPLLAVAIFGARHWMAMLEPSAATRAWYAIAAATLGALVLLVVPRLRARAARLGAAWATAAGVIALSFLAAGLPDEALRPSRWGALASGINRGLAALPGARVPYRGIDEWTRLDLQLGGTVLVALAGLLAFWPRRSSTGFPLAALIALVTLYAVPAVAMDFEGEFLRGALLTLLVVAALRLERLRVREARAAGALAAGAVVLGLALAPALDGDTPWWDYETWALSNAAARTTSFSWDHEYGVLDWPRDGREMLRVKARQAAYWKAQSLDDFDGFAWRQAPFGSREATNFELPGDERNLRRWTQPIQVSVRNLRSTTFVTAGIPLGAPRLPGRAAIRAGPPGIWSASRPLRRGDTYRAQVYTPKPTERELAAAGTIYERDLHNFRSLQIDGEGARADTYVTFPEWGAIGVNVQAQQRSPAPGMPDTTVGTERAFDNSTLSRSWALAKRLKRRSNSPFEYVKAVETYLGRGFSYTEAPPTSAETLEGFLFEARAGFCQQYSGAMAMLLRMGGVPARVATGFTAGAYDRRQREHVVRDLDAHSWVEAWFPNIGWVTFDPTPSSAPPRSQSVNGTAAIGDAPDLGSGGTLDPRANTRDAAGGSWERTALFGGLALAVLAGLALLGVRLTRRSRLSPLLELERALRRARRDPVPGATLQGLERSFAASPAAVGYVRALREARYAGRRAAVPTDAQRRGLRAELARGGGLRARLRAWWALPPRRPKRRRTIDAHG